MPAPHGCYSFVQGAAFTVVENRTVIVSGYAAQPEVQELSKAAITKMTVGDVLLKINGKTFDEYQTEVKWDHGGNTESGLLRRSLAWLSARSGRTAKAPVEKEVVYELKSSKDGSVYSVTMPWVLAQKDDCIAAYQTFSKNTFGSKLAAAETAPQFTINNNSPEVIRARKQEPLMVSDALDVFKEYFDVIPQDTKITYTPTSESIIKWTIFEPAGRNMGVISISSFVPTSTDSKGVTLLIRDLLLNQLKDTSSLLLELRNNGGGNIQMADLLPQLFGGPASFKTNAARAVVGPVNDYIFGNFTSPSDPWYRATQKAAPGDKYSVLVQFDTEQESNTIGTAYVKPVGVFTNGNCFSACELFSANMQDNRIATIFGEDLFTGAGGANVVTYSTYLQVANPLAFKPFPYVTKPDSTPLEARVGWRQSVRVGTHDGGLIEDDGIAADANCGNVLPNTADLLAGSFSSTQYQVIADKLKAIGDKNGKNSLFFQATPDLFSESLLGVPSVFSLDIAGVSKVQVYTDGKPLGNGLTIPDLKRQKIDYSFDPKFTQVAYKTLELRAFGAKNEDLFQTKRTVRYLPSKAGYLTLQDNTVYNLDLAKKDIFYKYDLDS
ncbi:hypothetical protein HDU91_000855, partial [Kappamyces sp. JEL0680]